MTDFADLTRQYVNATKALADYLETVIDRSSESRADRLAEFSRLHDQEKGLERQWLAAVRGG